jgi:SanA protein
MKKITLILFIGLLFIVSTIMLCHYIVVWNANGKIYTKIEDIPASDIGLLLGTPPQTRYGGMSNSFFNYRIDAAEALYKAGKIGYLLISGDDNSLNGLNEVQCMKDSLIIRGIPASVIFLDGKGLRTFDSVVRTSTLFGVKSFTVISQKFHNERAIYLAEHLNLDIEKVQAFNAKSPTSKLSLLTYLREYLARVKMFIDIFLKDEIEVLDEKIDLNEVIQNYEFNEFMHSINTVDAHNEQDTIIGNFTGTSIDTLYVDKVVGQNDEKYKLTEFFLRSTNIKIPSIELYGYADVPPKLVNEGDLDGNGTSEVGYLHTWMNSQWRYYRILTLVNNEWRYLIDGDYLDTPEWFRHAGVEIAKPGKKNGTILIHHYYEGYDSNIDERVFEIRDTIVSPTFTSITD